MTPPPAHSAAGAGGVAQQLPAGRLAGFEDDDPAPDLASMLSRRAPRARVADATGPEPEPAPERAPAPAPVLARRASRPGPRPGQDDKQPAQPSETVVLAQPVNGADRANRIRSSSVHIPAALIDRIIAERERSGRSNGEIVIAAIEATHSELQTLICRRDPAGGGGLFATRASRGARMTDGPLTALNVRLFEADYGVIDKLVAQFGAYSRGHLITAALTAYLDATQP